MDLTVKNIDRRWVDVPFRDVPAKNMIRELPHWTLFEICTVTLASGVVGFGGLEDIRFRGIVRPGDRFVVVSRLLRARRGLITCEFQCFVENNLVCQGIIKGISLPPDLFDSEKPAGA